MAANRVAANREATIYGIPTWLVKPGEKWYECWGCHRGYEQAEFLTGGMTKAGNPKRRKLCRACFAEVKEEQRKQRRQAIVILDFKFSQQQLRKLTRNKQLSTS